MQTEKLFNLQNVSVAEHPFLNTMKGIISSYDFQFMSKEEIQDSLKEQYCTDIRKITRKVDNEIMPTNNIIATFNLPQLPARVRIGFLSLNVRPYYTNPLRCFKCQRFGHSSKFCDSEEICGKCSLNTHLNDCDSAVECYNCAGNHVSWSKECDIYKQEQAITKIKVDTKVDYFQARQIYQETYTLIKQKERPADVAKNLRRKKFYNQQRDQQSQSGDKSNASTLAHTTTRKNTVSETINTLNIPANTANQPKQPKDTNTIKDNSSCSTSLASAGQYAPTTTKSTQSNTNTVITNELDLRIITTDIVFSSDDDTSFMDTSDKNDKRESRLNEN